MQTKKSRLGYTIFIMLFTFCIYGGFYEWGIAAAALLIIAGIICSNLKYSFQVPLFPLIILCIAILTTIWSIDYTENLLGIIRISAVVWWIIYCSALNKREKEIAIASIPYMGIAMTICGFFTLLFDSIYPLFGVRRGLAAFSICQYLRTVFIDWHYCTCRADAGTISKRQKLVQIYRLCYSSCGSIVNGKQEHNDIVFTLGADKRKKGGSRNIVIRSRSLLLLADNRKSAEYRKNIYAFNKQQYHIRQIVILSGCLGYHKGASVWLGLYGILLYTAQCAERRVYRALCT